MATFTFRTNIPLEPIRLKREAREREAEKNFYFGHHANPARHLNDFASVESIVRTPHMTEIQSKAFETAMNRAFRHFQSDFENAMLNLKEQSENTKGQES